MIQLITGPAESGGHLPQQYGNTEGTKLERFLPKNQHTQRKLLNFENWVIMGRCQKVQNHPTS